MDSIILMHQSWCDDPVYEIFDSLQENKKNDIAGWLFSASLGKLLKDGNEFHDKNESTSSVSEQADGQQRT